jgi:hypothetical protein
MISFRLPFILAMIASMHITNCFLIHSKTILAGLMRKLHFTSHTPATTNIIDLEQQVFNNLNKCGVIPGSSMV